MLYVVLAYDSPSDARRRKLFRVLRGYGERKQFSLFEARVTREQWARLKAALEHIIEPGEDNLVAYFLSPENADKTWRVGNAPVPPLEEPDFV